VIRGAFLKNAIDFRECHQTTHLREWTALSGAVYVHEVTIATFEFQKLVESGTSFEERFSDRQASANFG
jgi:hypothetical protein